VSFALRSLRGLLWFSDRFGVGLSCGVTPRNSDRPGTGADIVNAIVPAARIVESFFIGPNPLFNASTRYGSLRFPDSIGRLI
jgi:hypothetical protein